MRWRRSSAYASLGVLVRVYVLCLCRRDLWVHCWQPCQLTHTHTHTVTLTHHPSGTHVCVTRCVGATADPPRQGHTERHAGALSACRSDPCNVSVTCAYNQVTTRAHTHTHKRTHAFEHAHTRTRTRAHTHARAHTHRRTDMRVDMRSHTRRGSRRIPTKAQNTVTVKCHKIDSALTV